MKKLFSTILLVIGFSLTTLAQQSKGDVELGYNIGFNTSTVSNSRGSAQRGNGFNIGASADYYFSNRWSIKGKLIYDQKGWNEGFITDSNTGQSFPTDYNLNYLTVPVMANWHFGSKRNWYLNFGPYAGFLLSAKDSQFKEDVKSSFKNSDFGLALGIGVKIPVSSKCKIVLEYDEQTGITDIFNDNQNSATRNSRGSFNVGLIFILK